MKTILIPTDFSDTAKNAARYAVDFASSIKADKIVLYNGYAMPIATEMTWALMDTEELRKSSEEALEESKLLLKPWCEKSIQIETLSDFGFFEDRITEIAERVQADIIIMGISGGGGLERALFGSNALSTIHNTITPVLVIPPECNWKAVEKIAWACDYQNVMETTPLHIINKILELTRARLFVVHNHPSNKNVDPQVIQENLHLHQFFKDEDFEFEMLEGKDLSESVNRYVSDNGVDWLIVVPKKHGWLSGIFSKSHTRELIFHTHIPMLCLHQ